MKYDIKNRLNILVADKPGMELVAWLHKSWRTWKCRECGYRPRGAGTMAKHMLIELRKAQASRKKG